MVERKKGDDSDKMEKRDEFADLKEGVKLALDFIERGSSLIIIGGICYYVPVLAVLKLATRPHDVVNMGYMAYDLAKLTYLIGKGVICKLIQVKDSVLAIKASLKPNAVETSVADSNVRDLLVSSFEDVSESEIETVVNQIEVEDNWILITTQRIENGEELATSVILATS